jgi:hypothetical protein
MEFSVRDVQWMWLELTALLDYMQIYKPCMDGYAPSASGVANMIGIFTYDLQVVQDFVTAGLPCWLICPASDFTNQIIQKIVKPEHPEGIVSLTTHQFLYPVLFTGPASSLEKYHGIHGYTRNFLHAPDPFNTSIISPSVNTSTNTLLVVSPFTQACQRLMEPPVASSSTQHLPFSSEANLKGPQAKPSRQKNWQKTGKCISACVYTVSHPLAGCPQPSGPPSHNKFRTIENNTIVLIPISSWALALAAVDTNPSRVDSRY